MSEIICVGLRNGIGSYPAIQELPCGFLHSEGRVTRVPFLGGTPRVRDARSLSFRTVCRQEALPGDLRTQLADGDPHGEAELVEVEVLGRFLWAGSQAATGV